MYGQNTAEVLIAGAALFVAPLGTTLPATDGTDITLDEAFVGVGYTEDGTALSYTPTYTDIKVDEENAPIDSRLTDEKATISAKLAQATIANLNRAIAGSTMTTVAKDATHASTEKLTVGGKDTPDKVIVLLKGKSTTGLDRIVIGYIAQAQAAVALAFKKNATTVVPVEFRLFADGTRAAGDKLFSVTDHLVAKG